MKSGRRENTRLLRVATAVAWVAFSSLLVSCGEVYPEVVVVNETHERVLLRDVSFNGCLWDEVLSCGESSRPQRCPPGAGRVHFKKLDVTRYCAERAELGVPDPLCGGGEPAAPATVSADEELPSVPLWFNYQTISEHAVGYGDFERIVIRADDLEQDFSTPGPYGH